MSQSISLWRPAAATRRGKTTLLALTLVLGTAAPISPALAEGVSGAVFTMTNSAVRGNKVVAYARQEDGSLELIGAFPTGGLGSGPAPTSTVFGSPVPATADGLGSQNSLILSDDRRFLFAVNAGSDSISCFRVKADDPRARTVGSGGVFPVSLTFRARHDGSAGGVLYVLNAGNRGNITGFRVGADCAMTRLAGSQSILKGLTDDPPFPDPEPNDVLTTADQVSFTPDGRRLVVAIKGGPAKQGEGGFEGGVAVYGLLPSGRLGPNPPTVTEFSVADKTAGPFSFVFAENGDLVLNHANSFTVASYRIEASGALTRLGGPVPISALENGSVLAFGGFNCWVVRHGNVVYVMTFGDIPFTNGGLPDGPGVISALRLGDDGSLELLPVQGGGAAGVVAVLPQDDRNDPGAKVVGNHGIDLAVVEDGDRAFLYAVQPRLGQIGAWEINADGTLHLVGHFGQGLREGVDPFAGTNPGIDDFLERCFLQGRPRSPECAEGSAQGLAGF